MKRAGAVLLPVWLVLAACIHTVAAADGEAPAWVQKARRQALLEQHCHCGDPAARCVVTEGWAVYNDQQTEAGAVQRALNAARLRAVERACGLRVQGVNMVRDAMFAGAYLAAQSDGYVVEEWGRRITANEQSPIPVPAAGQGIGVPAVRTVGVELTACVRCQNTGRDPYFRLDKAALDRPVLFSGDKVWLTLRATADGWLYIFNLTADNRVVCLHPCLTGQDNRLAAGRPMRFPKSGGFVVHTNPGHAVDHEAYLVLLTRRPVPFEALFEGPDAVPVPNFPGVRTVSLPDLLEAVTAIPIGDRHERILIYEVREKQKG